MKNARITFINPLTLGVAYFVASLLLLGLEQKSSVILGWIAFGISVVLFIAVFEKHFLNLLSRKGGIALRLSAFYLGIMGYIVGLLEFLSGRGGWIVWVFIIFGLLWLVTITGATVSAAKNKKAASLVALGILIYAVIRFAFFDYVQGVSLLIIGVFLLLIAMGKMNLPEPPDS